MTMLSCYRDGFDIQPRSQGKRSRRKLGLALLAVMVAAFFCAETLKEPQKFGFSPDPKTGMLVADYGSTRHNLLLHAFRFSLFMLMAVPIGLILPEPEASA